MFGGATWLTLVGLGRNDQLERFQCPDVAVLLFYERLVFTFVLMCVFCPGIVRCFSPMTFTRFVFRFHQASDLANRKMFKIPVHGRPYALFEDCLRPLETIAGTSVSASAPAASARRIPQEHSKCKRGWEAEGPMTTVAAGELFKGGFPLI